MVLSARHEASDSSCRSLVRSLVAAHLRDARLHGRSALPERFAASIPVTTRDRVTRREDIVPRDEKQSRAARSATFWQVDLREQFVATITGGWDSSA